ncbi:uncharacterized protein LOC117315595 [Pecten maximus]|uniref:uncharacterized protein LOC117315595 n=1 Tax=Pecten maximus TaxID=6579 RepID=UPI00145821BE|nr:uncharacterized protein LOC117315595 [Pecten maximus]
MAIEQFILLLLWVNVTFTNGEDSLEMQLRKIERDFSMSIQSLKSELKDTQAKLQYVESELVSTKSTLKVVGLKLLVAETKLKDTGSELKKTQSELEMTRTELSAIKSEFHKARFMSEIFRDESEKEAPESGIPTPCVNDRQDTGSEQHTFSDESGKIAPVSGIQSRVIPLLSDGQTSSPNLQTAWGSKTKNYRRLSSRGRRVPDEHMEKAFSAQMADHAQSLSSHQTVLFPHSILNEGAAYDNLTGIFTCPEAGVYHFSVTIMAFSNEQVETELVVNANLLMRNYAGGNQRYNQGSNSVMVHLNVGDRVWVRIMRSPGINNEGSTRVYGSVWSTFSGFKL